MIIERNKSEPTPLPTAPPRKLVDAFIDKHSPETVTVNPVDENYPLGDDDITLVPDEEDV